MKEKSKQSKRKTEKINAVFCVAGEMIENHGEDSYYYRASAGRVLLAAFDGCGGIGSRRYGNYSGKTGAYVASRAVCGGVKSWFEEEPQNGQALFGYIKKALTVCDAYADKAGRLMGSLGKSFPTTAAIICADQEKATCFWAGDSRCYMLDADGLHQLSEDDISGEDAFSNLSGDGVLTNVICSSAEFSLHQKEISIEKPCILLTATDGCFGYLNTPMEFEHLLTGTLLTVSSISEWEVKLHQSIREYTGDDYTLCVAVYGFEDFKALQKSFQMRNKETYERYIKSDGDANQKWAEYKKEYSRYMSK